MTKVVGVSKGRITSVDQKPTENAWSPPDIDGMTPGQIHEYYERLGHEAAVRGEEQLKEAHQAWIHGWTMEMERQDKLEHLKKGH